MDDFLLCPICGNAARFWAAHGDPFKYDCFRCGSYLVEGHIRNDIASEPLSARQIANTSGFLRENMETVVSHETLKSLRQLRTPSVAEKADKLIRHLCRIEPAPGTPVQVIHQGSLDSLEAVNDQRIAGEVSHDDEPTVRIALELNAVAWTANLGELLYILDRYLREHLGLVTNGPNASWRLVTPKGWEHVESSPLSEGRVAFVGMWFDPSMIPIFLESISKGIEDAGYIAYRVDSKEHNNDITDEILAGIRTSKFVVADFTGNRGGVYYEAGFASALGKEVIHCVREDHATGIHFDTRQLNYIRWKPDDLPGFQKALTARIRATVGQGPVITGA